MGRIDPENPLFEQYINAEAKSLNLDFRTKLGSMTEYGQAYSKEILKRVVVEYLSGQGARPDEVRVMAQRIISLIPSNEFRYTQKVTDSIDEFEEKQITLMAKAVEDRIVELDDDINMANFHKKVEESETYQNEKNLISKLLQ